jgi:hypothetical protein
MPDTSVTFQLILGAWVATGLTLFIFTFLYEDNPLFKLAEHLYVGISVGYTIVKAYDTVVVRLIYEPMIKEGDWTLLFPLVIGSLMLARYVPRIAWLSRIAFAFVVGVGSGLVIPRVISSYILKQVEDTIRPLVAMAGNELTFIWNPSLPTSNLNAIIVLIGVVSVLFYFFFSVEHTGPIRVVARTGIIFLMIAFGAAFGYTVMARMSLLIGRLGDLIEFAEPRYGYATVWLLGVTVATLVVWRFLRRAEE